jgi:hypothetical protein
VKNKRKKKPLFARLVAQLDEACKSALFMRDIDEFGNKCPLCENIFLPKNFQWNHLISQKKQSVKWDLRNLYRLCRGCNMRHEYYPEYFTSWWLKRHGEEAYQALVRKSAVPAKFKSSDLRRMLLEFTTNSDIAECSGVTPALTGKLPVDKNKNMALIFAAWFMFAGSIFINGKLKNDGRIANDTGRCADALEKIAIENHISAKGKEVRLR